MFANNQELKEIILPSELTTIGAAAFKNCTVLTTVRMGADTEYIGNEAFRGCTVHERNTITDSDERNRRICFL